jgi:hypothetical protein
MQFEGTRLTAWFGGTCPTTRLEGKYMPNNAV